MIKKSLLALFLVIATLSQMEAKKNADALLDKFTNKVKSSNGMKADFKLEIRMPDGKVKDSKDGVLKSKGSKFQIRMGNTQLICDGETIWNVDNKNKEVQINEYDAQETTISPEKLFSSSFKKDYNYRYVGIWVIRGVKHPVVRLLPKNKNGDFQKIELLMNPQTGMLSRGYVTDKGGNVYVYILKNVKLQQKLGNSDFTYSADAHPDMDVIDLR